MATEQRRARPTVKIDQDIYDQLEQAADERGVPIVWITNRLLREVLPDLKPASEFSLVREEPR